MWGGRRLEIRQDSFSKTSHWCVWLIAAHPPPSNFPSHRIQPPWETSEETNNSLKWLIPSRSESGCCSRYLETLGLLMWLLHGCAVQKPKLRGEFSKIKNGGRAHSSSAHQSLFCIGEAYLDPKGLMVLDYRPGWHSHSVCFAWKNPLFIQPISNPHSYTQPVLQLRSVPGSFRCNFTSLACTLWVAACFCLKAFHWVTD